MNRQAVYARVTDTILERLKSGVAPWHKPWSHQGAPRNFVTGRTYSGLNALILGMAGTTPYWLTYRQAQLMDCNVKKGAKGVPILFFSKTKGEESETGEEGRDRVILRYYHVFNASDVDGIDTTKLGAPRNAFTPLQAGEDLVASIQPRPVIRHGGGKACWNIGLDVIQIPQATDFQSPEAYYATLFHELTHWTGHHSRLNRATIVDARRFGDESYSKEELVAEMGAGFLCALTGIENATIPNSANYIANWLQFLRNDRSLLVTAASQAQKAADYLTRNWIPTAAAVPISNQAEEQVEG